MPSRSRASPRNSARQSSDPTPPSPTHLSPYTAVTTPPRDRHRTTSLPSPVQTPRRDGASLPLSPRQISSPRISQPMASPPAVAFPEPYPTGSPQADNTNSRYPTFNEPDSRSQPLERRSPSDPVSVASQRTSTSNVPWSPLSIVDEGSGSETNRSDETGSNWWERRRSKSTIPKRFVSSPRSGQDRLLPEEDEEAETGWPFHTVARFPH